MTEKLHIEMTPEIQAALKVHNQKWIDNAFATTPMDREKVRRGVLGMYAAAKLKTPRVIFVDSPLIAAVAGGIAAGLLYAQKQGWEEAASVSSIKPETSVEAVVLEAVGGAQPVSAPVQLADFKTVALRCAGGHQEFADWLMSCTTRWYSMHQGGNMWAGYLSYMTAFRDVYGLKLPVHAEWQHYEDAAEGGFRIMHEDFCLVCERPEVLKIDNRNQAHCEDGPSHRWRDGWSLWHIHGVKVTERIVMRPETITVDEINAEENAEVRRVMIDRYGPAKYLTDTKAELVHADVSHGLPRGLVKDQRGGMWLYGSDNSTGRMYVMPVPEGVKTCREAHEAICGFDETLISAQS